MIEKLQDVLQDVLGGVLNENTWHSIKDNMLAISGLVFGIIVVVLVIALGWFVVWKLFLVRFPFIRELVYGSTDGGKKTKSTRRRGDENELQPRRSTRLKEKKESFHTD